jgi:glycosyltransferase involved in cell wall biosynthesis
MKHTILYTIETGGPGGAESVLLALASRIDTSRFRCLVLLPGDGWLRTQLTKSGIPTLVAKSNAWYDLHLPRVMRDLIRREKVDLVHSHLGDQNFYSCLASRFTGAKVVVSYHGFPTIAERAGLRNAAKLWFVRHSADAIVVVSEYLRRSLLDLRFPPERVFRIYNGVDADRFHVATAGRLRAEFKDLNGNKVVGMVANLRESKGYEFFIQAARQVSDSMPHTRFMAIGDFDKKIEPRMRQLVQDMSLQDRFFFLGFRADVPEILRDLDIFVLSSVSEGFSLATVEAMAASKPVIVTRSGGPEEIIEDQCTGLLVPPADSTALAAKICELLAHPERAAVLAQSARAKVESMFTIDKMVQEHEQLYERLLRVA